MTPALRALGTAVGETLDVHLRREERRRSLVSRLACGAAFEAWLAFECRLLLEDRRKRIGLDALCGASAHSPPWLANEHKKVDLFVGESLPEDARACIATIEFKLVHNNKNWQSKADGVWADLFPSGKVKRSIAPRIGRLAVVGIVAAAYQPEVSYRGRRDDLEQWREELDAYLQPKSPYRRRRVVPVWTGKPHSLSSQWLVPRANSYFQLLVLTGRREA